MRKINAIVVHCSATESGNAKSIRKYHMEHNGWSDIGYHFVIKKDGDLEFGRPVARSGAHVSGHNKDTIGICLIGLYDFKEIQFDTLKKLLKALKEKHGDVPVNPHNHYTNYKTCPNEKHWPVDPKEILG